MQMAMRLIVKIIEIEEQQIDWLVKALKPQG
jgi:hypothetical protein